MDSFFALRAKDELFLVDKALGNAVIITWGFKFFMTIKWTFPKLQHGFNPPAVYRIDFDNNFFYVGSTKKLKTRMASWRTIMRREKFPSKAFREYIKGATSGVMKILEITTIESLQERETFHIRENFYDPFFLNQSANGYTVGRRELKPIPKYLQRKKKGKKKTNKKIWAYSKGVIQFDLQGNYIMSHACISDAAKHIGVDSTTISGHIKTKWLRGVLGKHVFRVVGDNSPWVLKAKQEYEKPPIPDLPGKPVIDLNTGVFYYSAREVSEVTGIKEKQLYKMLGGDIPNKTSYRYA